MQEFFPIMSTIFTLVKGNEADAKIPLLFLQNDDDLARWIKIEESYMNDTLPGTKALTSKRADTQRKPLAMNEFKPLYGLCTEDVNFLVGLVESKKVCIKSSRAKGASATLPTLQDAATREKLLRVMKNEMMCHYRGFHLPSEKLEYVPYTAIEWEGFATEKKVTRAEVVDWFDRALATDIGKKWLDGQTRNFNKTNNPSDCPREVINMWESFIQKRVQADMAEALEAGFAQVYLAKTMDGSFWNISGVLAQPDVVAWRGEGKKHLFIWFMFESSPTGPRAKILEDRKLRRLFDALEVADSNRNTVKVRSPAILLTDAIGFHEVLGHLMRRNEEFTTRLWD